MPFIKVMIHAVWSTKSRFPFLTKEIKPIMIAHILENAKKKRIFIDRLNGHTDHLHCLFGLNSEMSIAKTLQLLKGESAFWINKQAILRSRFEWADEYYAASVSESVLNRVRLYIDKQDEHHKNVTFLKEYDAFIGKHNTKN